MLVTFTLLVAAWAYLRGVHALWHAAGRGRGIRVWQRATFLLGILALATALDSPLDTLADQLFSAHMAQHLMLMTVAAPLLAAGGAHVAYLWAMPRRARVLVGGATQRLRPLHPLSTSAAAFVLHSLALWLWHAPPLYQAALRSAPLHALEHTLLLGTAVLFWAAVLLGVHQSSTALGGVLYVFALGAQCTGLGALIALSTRPWYPAYAASTSAWGLSPLDDQVLAGALMWVPAGFVYLGVALLLLGVWLRRTPQRAFSRAGTSPPGQAGARLPEGPARR